MASLGRLDQADGGRALVRGDPGGHPGRQLGDVDGSRGGHQRDRNLAVLAVGPAQHRHVGDRGMRAEHLLQFGRCDLRGMVTTVARADSGTVTGR
jgi:hypothetical protein